MYRNDAEISVLVKMAVASAFIPVDDTDLAIQSL